MATERKSLAHLSEKFNTAPPPGYVPGRGRGVSGFSKPPADPPRRGAKQAAAIVEPHDAAGTSDESLQKIEESDTRELDLGETERFEMDETSMDIKEAGIAIEPFNMKQERREGHFDDDFNYVWKPKGEDDDDVNDAWLGEVDEQHEGDDKIQKRRKLLKQQLENLETQEEAPPDVPRLCRDLVKLLQPKETVASALRRLSSSTNRRASRKPQRRVKRGVSAAEAAVAETRENDAVMTEEKVELRRQFDELTEIADKLLRSGRFDVYNDTRESLAGSSSIDGQSSQDKPQAESSAPSNTSDTYSLPEGVTLEIHEAVRSAGYEFDEQSGYYFSSGSGLFYDARSSVYWAPGGMCYYTWDSDAQTFIEMPPAETNNGMHTNA
mmetsp:Transcript_30825/g.50992  ORF Transcript_30825/g.50992 Transcript_30825/m.50992 type:complete len:381 (-) Transcript_30825:40-1182(-)|eukprot:CAMPEP_0119317672 /NCGR_PEP_ID=MMETSP1333-20130426/43837_1 /TAXON_ID=418940 /ORGANISM="Scyphosphaera apsteinii, Strain RCC1455" /LENGTH=380 /DNA_ID=CAMNT_0007323671 /DNA_START=98 /DNA_END=1240 /DNA_ORIENTATION=-